MGSVAEFNAPKSGLLETVALPIFVSGSAALIKGKPMNLLTTAQAAKFLFGPEGKKGTLDQWRYRKIGPKFRKIGKLVRYAEADLLEYLEQQARTGTSHQNLQTY